MDKHLRELIRRLSGGGIKGGVPANLTFYEAEEVFHGLLEGNGSQAQVAALLVALRAKGATADELSGFASASRKRLQFPELPNHTVCISTSRLGKFRFPPVSLAAALTAAASGASVLLHAAPHAKGAGLTLGDLWQGLVGNLLVTPQEVETALQKNRLACWAPTQLDPGWRRMIELEDEIGLRCAPDIVTKLISAPGSRLMTAAMPGPVLGTAGDAVASLGHKHSILLQGVEGSVDPSICSRTRGLHIDDGRSFPLRISPEDLGFDWEQEPNFMHEDRLESAKGMTMEALMGTSGSAQAAAQLGAGLMIRLAGLERDLPNAIERAREAIESGEAHRCLQAVQSV